MTILVLAGAVILVAIATHRRVPRDFPAMPSHTFDALDWGDLDMLRLATAPLPLVHRLATGASGTIYIGSFLGQPVAIKVLEAPTLGQVQAFIQEIQLAGTLASPFLVALEGAAWTDATDLQAVMEYMDLGDLRTYYMATPSFPWREKLQCAHAVAEGLFYLHSRQMIHRDVKSRNILLDSIQGTKVGDFGASKDGVYGQVTMTAAVGTYRWMAPEMLLFQGYTNAVDIYSLGVVLSELATHQLPYAEQRDKSDEAILRRVIHEELRPSFDDKCPAWFHTLAMACMAQRPDARPSASQVMYALRQYIYPLNE
ncbi:Aste57867_15994 [Aphanomyces stellatus]|uniref:Aste57867_15994 protein n=1 Tax=Aphanomyces stellatus TaxID=120398 RepID=A0A485L4G7_9STRA|nr:hypothetical protein As57867_015938 [Aphanomyces stellatus]VFT92779.1 Aste57867_15994 [Aphanomyces stellatus]